MRVTIKTHAVGAFFGFVVFPSGVRVPAPSHLAAGAMSPSSSEDDDADERVPYSRRPEWADVEPIPQPESANPVVLIDYADEYVDAMDVWRAVYRSRERSRRVLDLTRDVIGMNGGAYTVWHHRWELVSALGVDLAEELRYAGTMARANPKNYQVWNHMRLCSQAMKASGDDARETLAWELNETHTRIALMMDAKNIHAWTQRAWAVRTFGRWTDEMEFTERMIDDDVRNNSAWNQRFFCVVGGLGGFVTSTDDDGTGDGADVVVLAESELAFAKSRLDKSPHNESAWNYVRGILKRPNVGWGWRGEGEAIARKHLGDIFGDASRRRVGATSSGDERGGESDGESRDEGCEPCRHAACLLAECLVDAGEFHEAGRVFDALRAIDPVRANYHAFRRAHALGLVSA